MRSIAPAALALFVVLAAPCAMAQEFSKNDRSRGHLMLRNIQDEVRKNYYDPKFHGVDLDARFAAADKKIDEATSNGQVFGIIAQALMDFDDSHLFFMPPPHVNRVEYGWRYQAIGDKCLVTGVKPNSDAQAKGLMPGDEILRIDGFVPTRENLWKLQYLYNALRPQGGMRLTVRSPDGKERQVDVMAQVIQGKWRVDLTGDAGFWTYVRELENEHHLHRHRHEEVGDIVIWKMPRFDLDKQEIRRIMGKVRKARALVIDLRGNPGGYEETLTELLGYFFDHDLVIAEAHGKEKTKPITARTHGDAYKGAVVVLIDSDSASSAELFARVFQLEKRGTVVGDRSAGAVMEAMQKTLTLGADVVVPYGLSITRADLTMRDGKSLEHAGVIPDELLLPTPADLAAGRDSVLMRAAKLAGTELDAQKAAALFPIEWRK
ncbi:MAG TPA: S41 family peptidase [Thermoanaerobaculia bacterium]|jgi:C-terminal processing protease CtpA/Prc